MNNSVTWILPVWLVYLYTASMVFGIIGVIWKMYLDWRVARMKRDTLKTVDEASEIVAGMQKTMDEMNRASALPTGRPGNG